MGLFEVGKKKEKKSLEQLAREAIIAKGIKLVDSPPQGDYYAFNVIGVGRTETDSEGALEHFKQNLAKESPAYAYKITVDLTPRGLDGKRKRVYAIGYKPYSHPQAA